MRLSWSAWACVEMWPGEDALIGKSFSLKKYLHFSCTTSSPTAAIYLFNTNFQQTIAGEGCREVTQTTPSHTNLKYFSASQINIKPDFPTAAHCFVSVACLLVILSEPSHTTTSVIRYPKSCVPVLYLAEGVGSAQWGALPSRVYYG